MANRFVSPEQQFISYSGQPYAGGFLYFYVSGTSTPANTYQDQGLTIPNSNPVQLDSAGDAGNIFLDPSITYKVTLTDSGLNQIWTFDPVIPTDSTSSTGFFPLVSCSAAGTNAITLTPLTPSQQPSAYANFQVFAFTPVASSTGAVTAGVGSLPQEPVFVAPGIQAGAGTFVANDGPYLIAYGSLVAGSSPGFLLLNQNTQAIQSSLPLPTPQGYLTLVSGTPIITTDAVSATSVYYTPFNGLGAPIHNGVSIISTLLPGELPLKLTTSQVASNIYDVFLCYNGGTPCIGTGPTWAAGTGGSVAAGSCARGTGAGGAALVRTQGIWTNAASMNVVANSGSGNVSVPVPANQGIYLGSIFIDSTAGQVSCYLSYGQSRKWGVWNAYNRQPIVMQAGDTTASWTVGGGGLGGFRALNGNNANSLSVFSGLPEESYQFQSFLSANGIVTANQTQAFLSGIGFNNTGPSASGLTGNSSLSGGAGVSGNFTIGGTPAANFVAPPSIGISTITALEAYKNTGAAAPTASGGIANNILTARYRG